LRIQNLKPLLHKRVRSKEDCTFGSYSHVYLICIFIL
jgi:hypothetical protein